MQPFDETKLSAIQRKAFESMSEREKDLVRKGHPVKDMKPVRTLQFGRKSRIVKGRKTMLRYEVSLVV